MNVFAFLVCVILAQEAANSTETTAAETTTQTTKSTSSTTTTTTSTTTSTTTNEVTTQPTPSPSTTPDTTPQPITTSPAPIEDGVVRILDGNLTCVMLSFTGVFNNATIESNGSSIVDMNCEQPVIQYGDLEMSFSFNYTTVAEGSRNTTLWDIQTIRVTQDGIEYTAYQLEGMQAHAGSSYACITGFNTTLSDNNNGTATLTLSDVRIQYGIRDISPIIDDKIFSKAESCAADMEQSLLVPIVVACALAGLVLAICVAYIIGRRKTYSGYSAM